MVGRLELEPGAGDVAAGLIPVVLTRVAELLATELAA